MRFEKDKSIIPELLKQRPESPLIKEAKKPQIMFIPNRDYGLRKLYKRLGGKIKP